MDKSYQKILQFLYGPFFKVVGYFYRTYKSNRDWIEDVKTGEKASFFIRNGTVVILIIWILIWYFAPEGSGERLSEEVRESIGNINSLTE